MSHFFCKTSSPAGDLVSFLAGLKQIYIETGKKSVVYQRLNMIGGGYPGSIHPFEDEFNNPVCMPESIYLMLKPLLLYQEYIEDYLIYEGQDIDFDLDKVRLEIFTNQPRGSLNRWPAYAFPQMATDLSKKWVSAPISNNKKKIIINFTQRYRNNTAIYFFLKEHEDYILFAGLKNERDLFCKEWGLNIDLLEVENFLHLAQEINQCKFFIGCQSFCFQLAEALKVPRILETFPLMPNVIPIGEKAFDFYHQSALEYYFNKLIND